LESFKKENPYNDNTSCYLIKDSLKASISPIVTIWFELESDEKKELKKLTNIPMDFDRFTVSRYNRW